MSPTFLDVEGVPVSLGNVPGVKPSSAAWDTDPPRPSEPASARRNGAPLSEKEFGELVKSARAERAAFEARKA